MDSYPSDSRQRPSITLDAGYVSITSDNSCQSSKTFGLYGKKLICVICSIIILFLISFINFTCLLWFMYKLDWSFFDSSGSKVFHFNKINQQFKFYKQVKFEEPIYTSNTNDTGQIDFLIDKQIDMCGDQNSILFDDDQILLNTDNFYLKTNSSIDFTNLQSYKFNQGIETRVRLGRFNSNYIHNKHLNITAANRLTTLNINHAFISGENLVIEANRHNHRSILRFKNHPRKAQSSDHHRKTLHGNLRFKSSSVLLDLPQFPLLGNNYRSESGIYRICICNTTFLFSRSFAHQPCPLC